MWLFTFYSDILIPSIYVNSVSVGTRTDFNARETSCSARSNDKILQDTQTAHDCRTTAQSFWTTRFNPHENIISVSSNAYFQGRGMWRMDSPARGGRVQETPK